MRWFAAVFVAAGLGVGALPASAQLIPPGVGGAIEEQLGNGVLGTYVYQTLSFYNSTVFQGPYQFTGAVPCMLLSACPDTGGEPVPGGSTTIATGDNLSLPVALYWESMSAINAFWTGLPVGTVSANFPSPDANYTYNGYQHCTGGTTCFNGFSPLQQGHLNRGQCLALMIDSGAIGMGTTQGASPPAGLCSPMPPNVPNNLICPNPNFPVVCRPFLIGCGPNPPPPLCTAR